MNDTDLLLLGLAAAGAAVVYRATMSGVTTIRARVVAACNRVVPSDYGDAAFSLMTGGMFEEGFGSSCGYLPSWCLLEAGETDGRILNRTVPDLGLVYVPGANISKLVNGAKALDAWRTLADGEPEQGDIVFCSNGPPLTEHVFIFDECRVDDQSERWWASWDAGRTNARGHQCARHLADWPGEALAPAETAMRHLRADGRLDFIGGPRTVVGYVSLDALPGIDESRAVDP